ncbi:G2/mitotic-specific cyclin-B2 [Lemmus lemmus]
MALLRRPTVSSDLKNIDTGVNPKAKSHVTIRRAVLEEIGNKVRTRATQVAKKPQNIKIPVQPPKVTNGNKQPKPTASVKPVQMETLAPKDPSPVPEDVSMKEENLCQAFSDALLCKIEDIDNEDWENPQLCSDYVKDIYQYLRQLEVDVEQHTLAKYLMELTLIDYDMVHYHPSQVAAAASCLAQKVLGQGRWNLKQQYYTGYMESEVLEIMQHMAKNVVKVNENLTKFIAVKNKYASSRLLKISTIPQLNSKTIKDLASPLLGRL